MSMHRRRFLESSLNGGLLLGSQHLFGNVGLIEAIVRDSLKKARGATTEETRNYLNLQLTGGPIRYVFDAWIRTNADDLPILHPFQGGTSDLPLPFNPMIATKITGGLQYSTYTAGNGLLVPALFGQNVQLSQRTAGISELLPHMLSIRGYGSGVDGHPTNGLWQQQPVSGMASLSGLAADGSKKMFQAAQWPARGAFGTYLSESGVAMNLLGTDKPVKNLLEGIGTKSAARNMRAKYQDQIDIAKRRLLAAADSDTKTLRQARATTDNAMALIKKGVGDLDGYWNEAKARYQNVIFGNMRTMGVPGITDSAIVPDGSNLYSIALHQGGRRYKLDPNFDARDVVRNLMVANLAEGFALAEYVYVNGLVTTLEISGNDFFGFDVKEFGQSNVLTNVSGPFDMHEYGAPISVLISTMLFRGIAAGMLELIDKLKATTIDGSDVWSKTAIQTIAEFNRAPRSDGLGADHGFNQMATSVISGAFTNGPEVVGNIRQTGGANNDSGYKGTQGIAAKIQIESGNTLLPTPATMTSTVSQIIGAHNPWENLTKPLARIEGGKLKTTFGRGKIVG